MIVSLLDDRETETQKWSNTFFSDRKKKSLVRISTNTDLSDPVIQQQFLSQVRSFDTLYWH